MAYIENGIVILSLWQRIIAKHREKRDRCVVCGELACFMVPVKGMGKMSMCPGHMPPFTYTKGTRGV